MPREAWSAPAARDAACVRRRYGSDLKRAGITLADLAALGAAIRATDRAPRASSEPAKRRASSHVSNGDGNGPYGPGKNGHFWRPEMGAKSYFTASCVRKVWTLFRQLRGPHLSACAWWRRRSRRAATAAVSPSSLPQSSTRSI